NEHLTKEQVNAITLVEGGKTRSESVHNGLKSINKFASHDSLILIHDCARPLVKTKDIVNVIENLKLYPSVSLGYSITDTFKEVSNSGLVTKHLNRESLRGILTPQGFHFAVLWKAYNNFMKNPYSVTDDTEIVNRDGSSVKIIEGDKSNIKITYPSDLQFAEYYISNFQESF
ncbi:MAG: 2-C-methyl-D-erythritol 4-phosphate cytidylyltransferase, partial [Spirochaetota bacterium]|nr:2-C-methyl-D-erythritol 4-phosphate cytidylyltransferase [Spirochaetota bacterium]